jgi:glycosyltransferase involved in cell wall biosynthesis
VKSQVHIVHVRPEGGGIADYAASIDAIYAQLGYKVQAVTVTPKTNLTQQAAALSQGPAQLYHIEIGAGDSQLFRLSQVLGRRCATPQLLTIHDPGVVIWHPFDLPGSASPLRPLRFSAKASRLALNRSLGRRAVRRHLASPNLSTIYLRPDLATAAGDYYLPQPTYHQAPPQPVRHRLPAQRIGFSGFWDPSKGVETLLQAWRRLALPPEVELVVAGSTASPTDAYGPNLRRTIAATQPPVELAGFIERPKLDSFLQELDVLVLPYLAHVPNGASAMAMRAAELGTPIIASDIPSLRGQLGTQGATYVPPGNVAALAQALSAFLAAPSRYYDLATQTQATIFAAHSWTVVGQQLQTIIAHVLEASS